MRKQDKAGHCRLCVRGAWMNARRVPSCLCEYEQHRSTTRHVFVKTAYPIQATAQGFHIAAVGPEDIW